MSSEISTTLMETTFLVSGPSAVSGETGKARFGTAFVIARPIKPDSNDGCHVLVTAKHVFDDIAGDTATIVLRKKNPAGDAEKFTHLLKIRANGKALYTAHSAADVAVIDISLPKESIAAELGSKIININWFSSDEFLEKIAIHPGDELLCLGFPLGLVANDAGYPILRSGKIASYPVIPLKTAKKILFDFTVHPGNSGGPVYFSYFWRPYKNTVNLTKPLVYQKIFGLVTQKAGNVGETDPSIGLIIPSVYIKETIDLLAGFESKIKEE